MTTTIHQLEQLAQYRAQIDSLSQQVADLKKELYKGIEFVNEPASSGLIRIDQMNLHWLRQKAIDKIWGKHSGTTMKPGYNTTNKDGTPRVTDAMLQPLATELAAEIEANLDEENGIQDAINEVKIKYPLWKSESRIVGKAGEIYCCKNINFFCYLTFVAVIYYFRFLNGTKLSSSVKA